MRWLAAFRPPPVPAAISAAFGPDEHLLALASLLPGGTAAATRRGLYLLGPGESVAAERIPWHLVSKARLDVGTLSLTLADQVGVLPSGAVLLRDRPPIEIRPEGRTKLTDVVHTRVRGSVIASQRLVTSSGAGGWLALRSVAGQDGVVVQFRLDPRSPAGAVGLDGAVSQAAHRLLVAAGRLPVEEDPDVG